MKRKSLAVLGLVALLLLGQHVFAAGVAQAALPSRLHDRGGKADHPSPIGATIELLPAAGITPQAWQVVQWQDSSGGWHDVEGWQGNTADGCCWWVDAKDFGASPFRWVVKDGGDGAIAGVSQPFNLPDVAGQTLLVAVEPVAP